MGKQKKATTPNKRGGRSALSDKYQLNPIRERLSRTASKRGKPQYGNKKKVETDERIGKTGRKQTIRVRGNAKKVREEIQDFLSKYGNKKGAKVWVNFGTSQSGFWFGSKVGGLSDVYAYTASRAAEYGKKFGINSQTNIIGEAIIITETKVKR